MGCLPCAGTDANGASNGAITGAFSCTAPATGLNSLTPTLIVCATGYYLSAAVNFNFYIFQTITNYRPLVQLVVVSPAPTLYSTKLLSLLAKETPQLQQPEMYSNLLG